MKPKYEVIWIDDEWDKMTQFKEECKVIHNIYLYPFRTREAGMEALDSNISNWDAVVLDAKMFDQSETTESANLVGLRKAIEHLNQLPACHRIPYFISTGQPDLMDNETFEQSFGAFYIKEKDDLKLIKDIKDAVDKSTRFQIKALYPEAITCLSILNNRSKEIIIDILETMHFPETHTDFNPLLYYNPLRKILEYVFRAAHKVYIIPDECFDKNGNPNLSQCSHYLSGNNADIAGVRYGIKENNDRVVPPHIELMMRTVLDVGNINSHSTDFNDEELQKLEQYINENVFNSRYLIYSLALNICEITLWMKKYIEYHQDVEDNKKMCTPLKGQALKKQDNIIDDIEDDIGIVEFHDDIYHIEKKYVLNSKTVEQLRCEGKRVKIIGKCKNNSPSSNQYPFFAFKIQPLD